ncbi:MAG: hypothetical protein V1926_00280 [Candidatus Peregrinibacteria bacterium]
MTCASPTRRLTQWLFAVAGVVCLSLSMQLLFVHIHAVQNVRAAIVPLLAKLPLLEERLAVLTEQVEISERSFEWLGGSAQERIAAFALPEQTEVTRLVASFDALALSLKKELHLAEMSGVQIGEAAPFDAESGVRARPLTVRFTVDEEGLHRVLSFVHLSGLLTVADALTDEEIRRLEDLTEKENPVGIVSLEQFFSQDILRYARDAKAAEDQLLRSFASPTFTSVLQTVLRTSALADAERLFMGNLGKDYDERRLWPVQFLFPNEIMIEEGGAEGWYTLDLELLVLERKVIGF